MICFYIRLKIKNLKFFSRTLPSLKNSLVNQVVIENVVILWLLSIHRHINKNFTLSFHVTYIFLFEFYNEFETFILENGSTILYCHRRPLWSKNKSNINELQLFVYKFHVRFWSIACRWAAIPDFLWLFIFLPKDIGPSLCSEYRKRSLALEVKNKYLLSTWQIYMVANVVKTNNRIYCHCINTSTPFLSVWLITCKFRKMIWGKSKYHYR